MEIEKNIIIVHHGFDPTIFYPEANDQGVLKAFKEGAFTFLFTKGWVHGKNDRSGFNYLLQAFSEEFKEGEEVALMVKINKAYGNKDHQAEVNKLQIMEEYHNLCFIKQNCTDAELRNLYSQADCLVMPSLAEGFGLPALESLACGTPVLTTSFGGQTDFITNDNGWLIKGTLSPVGGVAHGGNDFIYEECEWQIPNVTELKKKLREAFTIKKEFYNSERIKATVKDWTWEKTAQQIIEVLK